jgi:hypothetical protein
MAGLGLALASRGTQDAPRCWRAEARNRRMHSRRSPVRVRLAPLGSPCKRGCLLAVAAALRLAAFGWSTLGQLDVRRRRSRRGSRSPARRIAMGSTTPRRVRVERGIYRQPNGKYAVCWRHAARLRFRTVGFDLAEARRERLALIAATREGSVPVSPRLRFETVAGRWLERFEVKVAAGERHPRTLEAHRYQLDRHLLPGSRGGRSRQPRSTTWPSCRCCAEGLLGKDLGERPGDAPERHTLRAPCANSASGVARRLPSSIAGANGKRVDAPALQESRTLARSSRRRPAGCLFARCALRAAPVTGEVVLSRPRVSLNGYGSIFPVMLADSGPARRGVREAVARDVCDVVAYSGLSGAVGSISGG